MSQQNEVYLETLDKEDRFFLSGSHKTGTVIYITPGSAYVEIDSYHDSDNRCHVTKHKTHWAGRTRVIKIRKS